MFWNYVLMLAKENLAQVSDGRILAQLEHYFGMVTFLANFQVAETRRRFHIHSNVLRATW